MTVDPLPERRINAGTKGFPPIAGSIAVGDVAARGWTFDDLGSPVLLLREAAIAHNVELMASYCADRDVELAPHGKTTMAPRLWDRQLAAGAWGITAATVTQARTMAAAGVPRILVANEVVGRGDIDWLAGALGDEAPQLVCYADAPEGVDLLADGLGAAGPVRPLDVLVELGHQHGRTGARTVDTALQVAAAIDRAPNLRLAGAAAFEGTIGRDRSAETVDAIRRLLDDLASLADAIRSDVDGDPIVSAGGSAYFDLVVERLAGRRLVLRSGCYVTHDDVRYERVSPFAGEPWERRFHPAIEIWGTVLSRPEPDVIIAGFGKRDVPSDEELPTPRALRTTSGGESDVRGAIEVERLNDQHAWCRLIAAVDVRIGDRLGCGISHPCTAFDRWRVIPVLDDDDRVVDAIATYF